MIICTALTEMKIIMKKSMKFIALMSAAVMSVAAVPPVSLSAAETVTASSSSESVSQTVKYGKVISVSGTKVKLALGEYTQNAAPDGMQDGQTPPEKPDGNASDGSAPNGNSPEGADGFTASGKTVTLNIKNEKILKKNGKSASLSDITEGDILKLTYNSNNKISGIEILSGGTMQGGTAKITDGTIVTDSEGSNAVFATGENAKITVSGMKIYTKSNSSRGLDATYGGSITASDMYIKTLGAHCAPVATDRGGETIVVSDSKLFASGDGSPCIYSTGDITAENCSGKATGSQLAVVEGKNSITLKDCTLIGAGKNGVMLYQSTSGDAAVFLCFRKDPAYCPDIFFPLH